MDLPFDVISSLRNLIVLLLSLTVHEFAHAWAAWRLGDDTAARTGRLTLNPIPHIDVLGTIILPLLNAPIGWAKPVPVNPARFDRKIRMSTGDIIVSAAGPLSNVVIGIVAAILYGLLGRLAPEAAWNPPVGEFLIRFMQVNAGLAIFNILPISPLDGSHVAGALMPYRFRPGWERFAQVGPMVLVGLLVLERVAGVPILSGIIGPPRGLILVLYSHIADLIA